MNTALPSAVRCWRMKALLTPAIALLAAFHATAAEPARLRTTDVSFQNEIRRAIERGADYLKTSQNSNGWWSTPDHPSVTALALSAWMGEPGQRWKNTPEARKGYGFILGCVKPDGSIWVTNLQNYNTSISLMALLAARDSKHDGAMRKARAFLVGTQIDQGEPGRLDTPYDGGVGYGSKYPHSDMNNTLTALEALYYSKHLATDQNLDGAKDLNWAAAIHFIQSCQQLPSNKQDWVSPEAKDRGGFVYYPGNSMAGGTTNAAGRVALRSYGSISYAGLLSYIYADVKRDDARVQAVMDWLRANYSLEENPGMGPQGYFYYLHLMTKALNSAQIDALETRDGRKLDWRREVAMKLINLQKSDGSWQNDNGRWWEKDANLVTAYATMSLEIIYRGM
jgi:squalene-hopene/tetraprenyl-beta-curcumene cyclase